MKKMSLSARVLIGLGLGIVTGVVLGDLAAPLGLLGQVFILLLQMPVLPYVALSLAASLGRLDYGSAVELAKKGGSLLVVLWVFSLLMVTAYPLTFPQWESAAFFSTSLVTPPATTFMLGMYIPANIFKSLAENMVPAVVLFSVIFGVTLIGMKEKENLLQMMDLGVATLAKISRFVAELAPIGVFAITAAAAGTMSFGEIGRLQVYVIGYLATSLVMALWVMPGLIASLTPLTYRQIVGPVRDVLVTAFATGNLFIVLPMLGEKSFEIVKGCAEDEDEAHRLVNVIVPTSFNFPNVGKLMTLTFVPFAGWFSGAEITWGQFPSFLVSGLFTFFGAIPVAIPFLLDQLRIPADMFEIYLVLNNLVNVRVGTLMSAMHIIVLAVLGSYWIMGLPIRWKGLVRYGIISAAITVLAVGGSRVVMETAIPHSYEQGDVFQEMTYSQEYPEAVLHDGLPEPLPGGEGVPRVRRIKDRGFLRVGYFRDRLPFAYHNTAGQVVGYDAEMAQILAADLGVQLEFVKIEKEDMKQVLDEGRVDLVMSGSVVTTDRLLDYTFSDPYMTQTLAFLVPDHEVGRFSDAAALADLDSVTVGLAADPFIQKVIHRVLPNARQVAIDSPRAYLRGEMPELDAVVYSAQAGSAWTLVYPGYSVAVPHPVVLEAPAAYPVAARDAEFAQFVSQWIDLKRNKGDLAILFDHWITGKTAKEEGPRWSVVRNVFGWGD